jgi:hypothetical protein
VSERRRALWTCPRCGHRFVTRNLWHSCGRHRLADHFIGRDPVVRRIFARFRLIVRACGPVTVYAQKTRIVFQVRVRFAGAVVRKRSLEAGVWLKRRAAHPCLARVEVLLRREYLHYFRFTEPAQLDRAFARLVREAYAIGQQARR